jgi:hypothetical protein
MECATMSNKQQQLESDLRSALFRYRNLSTAADFRFGQRPVMAAKMEQEQVLLALLEVQRLEAELERLENEEVKE